MSNTNTTSESQEAVGAKEVGRFTAPYTADNGDSNSVAADDRSHACAQDVGFGMKCRRERGHAGPHTWDPKRLYGEEPI